MLNNQLTDLFQPTSAPLFANRCISYVKSTPPNTAAAVEDARQATVLDPKWAKGWVRLGEALQASGATKDEIKSTYEKGLELAEEGRIKNGMHIYILCRIVSLLTFLTVTEIQEKLRTLSIPVAAAL